MHRLTPLVLLSLTCMSQADVRADEDRYYKFEDPHLTFGRTNWLGTCEGCHGWGIAGAPIPMNYDQWAPRIAKGREILYKHAMEGFFGPDDTMMPERGGNPELTNDEVRAAVDYMIDLAKSNRKHQGEIHYDTRTDNIN